MEHSTKNKGGLSSAISHILVDEFQDTNRLRYEWLKLLVGEKGNLFVVGDDDQSIYIGGAKVENMQLFQRNFPDHEIVRLEQNYRSPPIY